MKPFIPNDQFDIAGLEACWNYVANMHNEMDEAYFCELASKTFQLFYQYRQSDTVPKELLRLIPVMSCYAMAGVCEPYSVEDIARVVAKELVLQLSAGFKIIKNPDTGRADVCGEWMAVSYMNEYYQIDTLRFDLSPIKGRHAIKL